MPHVTGTARLSPRRRVSGRLTPRRFASFCVSDSQTPSSTRAPSRASRPTRHVPTARRKSTTRAPASQIAAIMERSESDRRSSAGTALWLPAVLGDSSASRVTPGDLVSICGEASDVTGAPAITAEPFCGEATVTSATCVHGASGRSGSLHEGSMNANTGIARWPTTAAVHTACRAAAERLRRKYVATAAIRTRTAPLSAASINPALAPRSQTFSAKKLSIISAPLLLRVIHQTRDSLQLRLGELGTPELQQRSHGLLRRVVEECFQNVSEGGTARSVAAHGRPVYIGTAFFLVHDPSLLLECAQRGAHG